MKISTRIAACMATQILVAGCNSRDARYTNEGIGTNLFAAELPEETQLQDLYIGYICRQAGLPASGDGALCYPTEPSGWTAFVRAGMNDIDQRCDGYLSWLDSQRRWTAPILEQIGDTQNASQAVMAATGSGPSAIAVVGAAFGLARNTFANLRSRLLLEVNHSTVQTIVFQRQTRFRNEITSKLIPSRPDAIHALRQYLRICMPFTIETEINTTITAFERGGPGALVREPLISARTVGVPASTGASIGAPVTARRVVERRELAKPTIDPAHRTVVGEFDPERDSVSYVNNILQRLCVPRAERNVITPKVNARIKAFQQWQSRRTGGARTEITGLLSRRDMDIVAAFPVCDSARYMNFYEADNFQRGINDPELIELMNKHLKPERQLNPQSSTVIQVRERIREIRKALDSKLTLKDTYLSDQLTFDLVEAL